MKPYQTITRVIPSSLLLSLSLSLSLPPANANANEVVYQNLKGQTVTISHWPAFIITSQSQEDLKDALRCATQVSSLSQKPHWLIDFAWPHSTAVKRRIAKTRIESAFMKTHSAILENSPSNDSLIILIDNQNNVLWNSRTYPSGDDWKKALDIIDASRAE
ncbi:MAG: hypothetical protein HOI15_06820 [Opitutales bacterium]|nr:hypothetical protein [Opitutales bacterium]